MERGYVKIYRKMLDCRSYSRSSLHRALMLTILLKAAWKPGYFAGELVEPGQFIGSINGLAEELKAPRTTVQRAFAELVEDDFVKYEKVGRKWTRFSITNWSVYQQTSEESGPQTGRKRAASGPQTGRFKRIKEEKNNSSEANASSLPATGVAEHTLEGRKRKLTGKRAETFLRFWDAFADKRGYRDAIDAWANIPKLTNQLVDRICESAARYAEQRPDILARNSTPKMAQGWLNGRRWEDEDDQPQWSLI